MAGTEQRTGEVLIVADDVTGANSSAAHMACANLSTVTVIGANAVEPALRRHAIVAVSTGSRDMSGEDAATRVRTAMRAAGPVPFVAKRIDSTLRGNIGAELDAALDVAQEQRTKAPCRALVVAAFPAAGRTTVGGVQLVDGVPLTEAAGVSDMRGSLASSRVAELVSAQSRREIREVPLHVVTGSPSSLKAAMLNDAEVLVLDAAEDGDLRAIAAAAAAAQRAHGIRWLPVDPGPFAIELARAHGVLPAPVSPPPILLVIAGSTTALTMQQLAEAEQVLGARFVDVDVRRLNVRGAAQELCALAAKSSPGDFLGVRVVGGPLRDAAVRHPSGREVAQTLGYVSHAFIDSCGAAGIYVTGGEICAAVIDALDATAIAVEREILPLVVAGRLVGGCADGLPIVTKGGLVGDGATVVACLKHLRAQPAAHWVDARKHPVRTPTKGRASS